MTRPNALVALLLAGIFQPALAQNAMPTPPPYASAANPSPATAPSPPSTLKASTQLVVVDVVVTDGDRKPVHGLKASDFSITEGKNTQVIQHFEEHSALTLADATKFPVVPTMPPGYFSNFSPTPANGAVNVLLLDALNTPMKDQAVVRQQLLAYLKAVPPGTRIAIFGLTSRVFVLQSFTSDPEILKAVLTRNLGKASPVLDDPGGAGRVQNSSADDMEDGGADADTVANLRQFEAQTQTFQLQLRAQYTLDAMNEIAHYLAGIPGRKNLIWFSGSFPINILPDITGTLPDPFAAMASSEDEFRNTVNLLARSQVAVYPIDARGLFTSPVFDAATNRNYGGSRGTARMNQDQSKFFFNTAAEQGTMLAMAEATGGRAFVNTNGLTRAVADAIDEGSNFYTLSYSPTNYQPDGKLHKIKVEVDRPGFTLAYRRGYYAVPPVTVASHAPNSPAPEVAIANPAAGPTSMELERIAMSRGTPTPTEILIKVSVFPTAPASQTEDSVVPGNRPSPKTTGPFRRYDVAYAINPSNIAFLAINDGKLRADLGLMIMVFNPEGGPVNFVSETVHMVGTRDQMIKAAAHGIQQRLEVSAPAKGQYFFRIAVHDINLDRYGAVEVSSSSVSNLTPPAVPPPSPPAK
jgi:VWFA-related protein